MSSYLVAGCNITKSATMLYDDDNYNYC